MNIAQDPRISAELSTLMSMKMSASKLILPPSQKAGSKMSGRHQSKYRGRGINFEEFRHYQIADDVRSLDWKVTLRTGEPHIRVYSEEKDKPVILVVDQRTSMFFSSVDTMKSVVAAHISACCAWSVIKSNDRIGALLFNDFEAKWYKPQRNMAHVSRVLKTLTSMNQSLVTTASKFQSFKPMLSQSISKKSKINSPDKAVTEQPSLSLGLTKLMKLKLKGSLLIFISDFSGMKPDDVERIKWLKRHNDVLGIAINDPMEVNLMFSDPMLISDGNHQLPVSQSMNTKLGDYNKWLGQEKSARQTLFGSAGFPLIELDTSGHHINHFLNKVRG
ncbi:DUF58 domain-containing protein [Vibrio kagoshimensis]|uniref:DUF58 domain-containing protein n=1 Tax=Vibrio kagoshimensis TaxID=2910244 RepID=UPI003D22B9BC